MTVRDKSDNNLVSNISQDFEIWQQGNAYYLVAQTPDFVSPAGVFTWRYKITDWDAINGATSNPLIPNVIVDEDFNILEGESSITSEDYGSSFYFGEARQLLFTQTEAGAEPYDHLVEALKEEAQYKDWILSTNKDGQFDFLAVAIEAAIEGRTVRSEELKRTTWWQTHTDTERAAMELSSSDPSTYAKQQSQLYETVIGKMISAGIQTLDQNVIAKLVDLTSRGVLDLAAGELDASINKIANPRSRYTLDPELQATLTGQTLEVIESTKTVAQKIDSVMGPGNSENFNLEDIANEKAANPKWYEEVFLPQIEEAFQNKYSQYKGTNVKTYEYSAPIYRQEWKSVTGQAPDETSEAWQAFFATNDVEERKDIAFAEAAKLGTQTYRDTLKRDLQGKFGKAGQRATGGGRFQ